MIGRFPFGQEVRKLEQEDRLPKKVFVLGVYASAVHGTWIAPDGKELVKAFAVSSEPYIFWKGDRAAEIIENVTVPAELGKLLPTTDKFNGPSGKALDGLFLEPLGISRCDAWLCDLVPHSCTNSGQQKAIQRVYMPIMQKYGLPEPSVPSLPKVLANHQRRSEIVNELVNSQAEILILLGDQPISWFLSYFDDRWNRLADFGQTTDMYGQLHGSTVFGRKLYILPLVHPRQAGRLGASSIMWSSLHQNWLMYKARELL